MTKSVTPVALLALVAFSLPAISDQDLSQGREVFTQTATPSCTICHALSDAGATGAIGPNLDELKPSAEQVRSAVSRGVGVMPAFIDSLTEEEIESVSQYVAKVAGQE